ncbi:hypothetical protein ACQJBY_047008 [Aegilops geniculata]
MKPKPKPSTHFPQSPNPMDELAGGRRRADPPPSPPPLLLLPDDMLVEILLRLPPEPIHLFRASFVSKHWRGLVHDARFLRRFREFHGGTPPVLGFFHNQLEHSLFVPTSGGFGLSTASMSHGEWRTLDCRHGRALLHNNRTRMLLVWDPMTGDEHYLPSPTQAHLENVQYGGAVLCAAGHSDHGDCHWRPFLVAFVFSNHRDLITSAFVYSSETGVWGEITLVHIRDSIVDASPASLLGSTLYWLSENDSIIELDLDKNSLDFIKMPYAGQIIIILIEDGRLGFAGVDQFSLHFCSRVASIDGVVSWTHRRVIDLEKLLAPEVVAACRNHVWPVGYAEDANVIFIYVYPSIYMIHLNSMQIEEVSQKGTYWFVFPYTSFYTPGITTGGEDDQAELLNGS